MSESGRIWRRRVALMAGLGLAAGLLAVLLFGGEGDADESAGSVSREALERLLPELSENVRVAGGRVVLPVPEGWRGRSRGLVAQATSPDRTVRVAVGVAGPEGRAGQVLRQALEVVREGYENVEVRRGDGARVAGLPTRDAVAAGRNPRGTPLRMLIAAASGDDRTYLIQVFSAQTAPPDRLLEAQVALQSLRLRG